MAKPARRSDPRARLLALLAAAAGMGLPAQAPVTLTTPDGSRCILVVEPALPHVHWATATWIDGAEDPAGSEGLARLLWRHSLQGTALTGSRDPARERLALDALDAAWQACLSATDAVAAAERVRRCDLAAAQLVDPTAFPRVMAALPAHRPELVERGSAGVLVLTTIAEAIPAVAGLLRERRDQPALRDLQRTWVKAGETQLPAWLADRQRPLRAELLALALPTHPFARQLETAPSGIPTRAAAAAVWAASQHPERSVHVLVGDFDVAATAATLREVFATTTLRPSTRPPAPLPRPLGGARRSQLQGVHPATVALAWPLPPDVDRIALATAATWLADGPDSELGQRLLRREQRQATVRCQAPWPPAADGQSLFVIEISHTGQEPPLAALTDLVRTTLQEVLAKPPTDSQLQASHLQLQRRWRQSTADPRQLAVELAAVALTWPRSTPDRSWPERLDVVAVQRLLAGLAGSQPAIVEGKP